MGCTPSPQPLLISRATGGLIPAERWSSSLPLPAGRWGTQDLSEHPEALAKPNFLTRSVWGVPTPPGF